MGAVPKDFQREAASFSEAEAFERNVGLISHQEQRILASAFAVIAGCGGVGGLHAHTLARLGIGRFRLADADTFALANTNRQIGATVRSMGKNKAHVTAEMIRSINPNASIEVLQTNLSQDNVENFVKGADLVLDGIDFFSLPARRQLFETAWRHSIPAVTAAPLGFSGTLHVFAKGGMNFDQYFDLADEQSSFDQLMRFIIGLSPGGLHLSYMDLSSVNTQTGRGPSSIVACQLAASLAGGEAIKILLRRGRPILAPNYLQFDCYRQKMRKGRLRGGNRNWLQRLKRRVLAKKLRALGFDRAYQDG